MSDPLVKDFINKYYFIVFKKGRFVVKDVSGNEMDDKNLSKEIDLMLGLNYSSYMLVFDWFNEHRKKLAKPYLLFLNNHHVIMTHNGWKILHTETGNELNIDDFKDKFSNTDPLLLTHIFDEWFYNKRCDEEF